VYQYNSNSLCCPIDIDQILNSETKSNNNDSPNQSNPNKSNPNNKSADSDIDSEDAILDIDADTETMNDQISKQMDKKNKSNPKIDNSDGAPKKVIKINKEMLKTLIIEYLSLDDQIKSFKETIKDKTEEKKQYENQILELMGALKQDVILTDKGNLERVVKESKGPLTPDLIKTALTEILKCSETASTYTEVIIEKRPTKELISLKRKNDGAKNPKIPKSKDKGPLIKNSKSKSKGRGRKKKDDDYNSDGGDYADV
jgi:hypothetical protein